MTIRECREGVIAGTANYLTLYYQALKKAKKSIGKPYVRASYYALVIAVGDCSGGKCADIAKVTGRTSHIEYQMLIRVLKTGLIERDFMNRYFLTERGQMAYNTFKEEFKPKIDKYLKELVATAKKDFIYSKLDSIAA